MPLNLDSTSSVTASPGRGPQPQRTFIGWEKPVLPGVVDELLKRTADGPNWDLRDTLIVLPSSLAGRRLIELLSGAAKRAQKILHAPKVVTVGALPEHLYVAKQPFASDLVQQLAWAAALRAAPAEELAKAIPLPPASSATVQWLELGKILCGVHRELASDRLDFARVAKVLGMHVEGERWQTLAKFQRHYLDQLDALGLWDIQTARLCALDWKECATDKRIFVVGCVDLNRTQRGFLEAVREQIEVWVVAPPSAASMFDDYGCLVSDQWQEYELNVPSDALLVGSTPSDQVELTAACLGELGGRFHRQEITLGVPEPALITELQQHLSRCSVPTRFGPGTQLAHSEPGLLLSLIADFLDGRSYPSFAALIRHPAVYNMLSAPKVGLPRDWLAQVDEYYQQALPKQVGEHVNDEARGAAEFRSVVASMSRWLAKLPSRSRRISQWVQPLLGVLASAYQQQRCALDDPHQGQLYAAGQQVRDAIVALRDIPAELEPSMAVSELIDWLLRSMAGGLVPAPEVADAVEMLGWLELVFDDAPALIITGMHDGVVPESVNADAFLPNGLRRQLGMMDNSRRYARDLYFLQVMLAAREHLRIVVGKTDHSGDPLVPSRLLLAGDLQDLPGRVLHLVEEESADRLPPVAHSWKPVVGKSRIEIPVPEVRTLPDRITVTAFRDYLACPYRFYLRHVLKLRDKHDENSELDASMFGNLLHDTLEMLGSDTAIGQSTDAEEIAAFLVEHLERIALQRFGPSPPAAVLIQIEQARQRLEAFAPLQAARAAEGWEIRYTEAKVEFDDQVQIGNGARLNLIGRIDRIDFHPATNSWAIWDYKSSDSAKRPVSVHWSPKEGWKDLQLPLYRPLAQKLGVDGPLTLGYIVLPKQAASTDFATAEFSVDQLAEADALADEIATKVADGDFWPAVLESVKYDDYERLCQSGIQHVEVAPPRRNFCRFRSQGSCPSPQTVSDAKRLLATGEYRQPPFEPLLIRASAGTGKTFQLTNRLLQVILAGQDVDGILATTFTRKAAGEIMARVLHRLARACLESEALDELQRHVVGVEVTQAHCLAALRRVTASLHRFRISTLDSFFAQVARTFSLEMGLPPGWSAMDPTQEPQIQMQAIGQLLDQHERGNLLELVRMLSKGESGRQVAEEIRQTVAHGLTVYRATKQIAWDQLPVPAAPSEQAVESALLTLENIKWGNKSADEQLEKLHLAARSGDWESVVEHGIYAALEKDPPTYYRREIPGDLAYALKTLRDRAAAELLPIRRLQTLASYHLLEAYDRQYSALIRRSRMLAFSDVAYYLARWMPISEPPRESALQGPLQFRLDCGVQHLLLDEFQDTAPEQWQILRPLAEPLGGDATSEKSFFCVGDSKQAIYGWRGGVAEIFDSVAGSIQGLKQADMQESYRSSPQVIEAVNRVFTNLDQHQNWSDCDSLASRWAKAFPVHATRRRDLVGFVRLQNAPKLEGGTKAEQELASLEFTTRHVAELCQRSTASIGILLRTNDDVATMISLLRDAGIAASQDGGNPLTDSVGVTLVLSLVHLADHPGDNLCAFHLSTSPLADQLPYPPLSQRVRLAAWFRESVYRRGLGASVEMVADMLANSLSWWDQHRLRQLIRFAYEFQPRFRGRVSEFERAVMEKRIALPNEAQVKVMTIHKSKGLEFDAVFLPVLDIELVSRSGHFVFRGKDPCAPPDGIVRYMNNKLQALLPQSWQTAFSATKQRGISESLCLLYVAMTRARHALYMTTQPAGRQPYQNFGSLLQSTLGDPKLAATPEAVLYEKGDAQWYAPAHSPEPGEDARGGVNNIPEEVAPDERVTPAMIEFASNITSGSVRRNVRREAPSAASGVREPLRMRDAFALSQSLRATYGTIIHTFFSQIQWLEDFEPNADQLKQLARATVEAEALRHVDLDSVVSEFSEMLELPNVKAVLSRNRYRTAMFDFVPESAEINTEHNINVFINDHFVSATVDRIALLMRGGKPYAAEVFDYKTDTFDPRMGLLWLDDRVEYHRPQLAAYAQVVAELYQLPPENVSSYLLMLSTDDLVVCSPVDASRETVV